PLPLALDTAGVLQAVLDALETAPDKRSPEQAQALAKWYGSQFDEQWQKLNGIVQEHLAKAPKPNTTLVQVCSEGVTPIRHHTQGADFFNDTYFLRRGDCDQKMGVAPQGFLQVLMTAPEREKHWQIAPPEGSKQSY